MRRLDRRYVLAFIAGGLSTPALAQGAKTETPMSRLTAYAFSFTQLDGGEIWDEIGLPHMIAGAYRNEIALARKVLILAGAGCELVVGLEYEARIMEGVHDQRQIGGRDDERAVEAGTGLGGG